MNYTKKLYTFKLKVKLVTGHRMKGYNLESRL